MRTSINLFLCFIMLSACRSSSIDGVVRLNENYRFFTREVYRKEDAGQEKGITTNAEKSRKDLLEVQFLMLCDPCKSAIYFAMKPDLNRKHYENYNANTLNIDDVHRLRLGKITLDTSGRLERIKFFSKDLYNSTVWEITSTSQQLQVRRIQQWWGDYDSAYLTDGIDQGVKPSEFLESEINVDEALREPVLFLKTQISHIKHKNRNYPIPRDAGIRFKAYGRSKFNASLESTVEVSKAFKNKQIQSSPIPLFDR